MLTAAEHPLRTTPLRAWTWIDSTPDGLVSFILITPASSDTGLGAVARAAGLQPPDQPLPAPGIRLILHDEYAMVVLPRAETALRVPTDEGWADFVRRGGTVVVILGDDPLEADSGRVEVEQYLLRAALPGGILMAKTTLATTYSDAEVRAEACVVCGRPGARLIPVGYAYTPTSGAPLGWSVVAHSTCATKESAR